MDKVKLTIAKWDGHKRTAIAQRTEAAIGGAKKKDLNAMDAYIKVFDRFITDLHRLK